MKLNHIFALVGTLLLTLVLTPPSSGQESSLDSVSSLPELATWLEKNPPAVTPITGDNGKKFLAEALTTLRQKTERLRVYLYNNGAIGSKWTRALYLDDLRRALAQYSPSLESLEVVQSRFHSHQWGLEVTEIREVAKALDNYVTLRLAIDENFDPTEGLKESTERLIKALKTADKASFKTTSEINEAVRWLEEYRQAPELCKAIQRLAGQHNLFFQFSDNFVLRFFNRDVDQTQQIAEYIVGRPQYGRIRTVGTTKGQFNPDPQKINISIVLNAVASGNTYSQARNVTVYSTSSNKLYATKDIYFDGQQLSTKPANSTAQINSRITGINSSGGLVQSVATNKAYELKPQADAEANYKARVRVETSVNNEVNALVNKARTRFADFTELYRARGIYPSPFNCSTTENKLELKGLVSDGVTIINQAVPQAPEKSDIFIAVHQSALIEAAKMMFADLKADQRVFLAIANSILPEEAYKEFAQELQKRAEQSNNNLANGYIYFNEDYPLTVQFAKNEISFAVRIDGFQANNNADVQEIPMNFTATYKIGKIDNSGVTFVLAKEPELIPRDFEDGNRKLKAQETTLRNRIQGEFKDSFPKSFQIKSRALSEMTNKNNPQAPNLTGTLKPVSVKADNGWLTINWLIED